MPAGERRQARRSRLGAQRRDGLAQRVERVAVGRARPTGGSPDPVRLRRPLGQRGPAARTPMNE